MSRKVRPLPPAELQARNPEGYARAVDRHLSRLVRQGELDARRADRAVAALEHRVARTNTAPARAPRVGRLSDLAARGYLWIPEGRRPDGSRTPGGWRYVGTERGHR